MANRNLRLVTKQTAVPGKVPSGTTGSESGLIKQGELAINTSDHKLFSFDGSDVFEVGSKSFLNKTGGTVGAITVTGDSIFTGNLSASTITTENLTIKSGATSGYILISNSQGEGSWADPGIISPDATFVQYGINTFTGGTTLYPSVNVTGLSIDNISVSGESSFEGLSATTLYSGDTDLSGVFAPIGSGDTTRLQTGLNTYTGGTDNNPTVNVSGLSIDNITVSGESSFEGLSATTLYSGDTDLSGVFAPIGSGDTTRLQTGLNTYTGGTVNNPTVNVTALTIDNISVSGESSFEAFSATTIYSGDTDLGEIFAEKGEVGDITRVGDGINTFTGGTVNNPTVNVTALTIDNISVSGESSFEGLSATTLYSGDTDLSSIFNTNNSFSGLSDTLVSDVQNFDKLIYQNNNIINIKEYRLTFSASSNSQDVFNVLNTNPINESASTFSVNGITQVYGEDKDFYLSGNSLYWNTDNKHIIETNDTLCLYYY